MQELGFPTFVVTGWYGMFAPPGTPASIAQKLRDEASKAIGPAEVVETLARKAWSRAARSLRNMPNTWSRSSRSIPRLSRTQTSSRRSSHFGALAAGLVPTGRVCLIADTMDARPTGERSDARPSHGYRRAFRYNRLIIRRNGNALSRGPWIDHFGDNFLWSNATLILKGHGALRRRVAGGRWTAAARSCAHARARLTAAKPGSRNGARSAT